MYIENCKRKSYTSTQHLGLIMPSASTTVYFLGDVHKTRERRENEKHRYHHRIQP